MPRSSVRIPACHSVWQGCSISLGVVEPQCPPSSPSVSTYLRDFALQLNSSLRRYAQDPQKRQAMLLPQMYCTQEAQPTCQLI